jgi:alpha-beta hydrolase superfamily lysophospholipase
MRPVALGDVVLHMESPEAARYHAPILIVPGLFQSPVCWRGVTSILAHRGWEVYLLPRVATHTAKGSAVEADKSWDQAREDLVAAARRLGGKVIVFGSDVGAALALSTVEEIRPMALALFAPTEPVEAGKAFARDLGFFGRRRYRKERGSALVAPLDAHLKSAYQASDAGPEPRGIVDALIDGVPFRRPSGQPPTIVFGAQNDPLVDSEHSLSFSDDRGAKTAESRLVGRWWPAVGWEAASEQTHRFLILTLADRVVEFPDEILAD